MRSMYGDKPVQAYIAAMPGWKRDVGKRLDALIMQNAPTARKAVKWNSPFYGIQGQGWFVSFHVFTRYVKVTFFRGTVGDVDSAGGRVARLGQDLTTSKRWSQASSPMSARPPRWKFVSWSVACQ